MNKKEVKLYNILLPIWILIFCPTWLWLILIPANYLIDRLVLRWSLGAMPDKGAFCRKHTWKICLAGFFSDFIGAAIMFAVFLLSSGVDSHPILEDLSYGIGFNPFSSVLALIVVLLSIAVSGQCIYLIDRKILKKAGLDPEQAKKSAVRLALITAPYLYLFPSVLLYGGELTIV